MTRLHFVQKARKPIKDSGIEVGDSYYWWKFAFGTKRVSKIKPRRSALTQSEFLGTMYDLEDDLGSLVQDFSKSDSPDFEAFASDIESIAEAIRSAGEECEEKKSNMPDALQEAPSGELLGNRADQCQELADDLETAAGEIRELVEEEKQDDETPEEFVERVREAAVSLAEDVSWNYE